MPLETAHVTAPAQVASGSPGSGGFLPVTRFQPKVSRRWVVTVVRTPITVTVNREACFSDKTTVGFPSVATCQSPSSRVIADGASPTEGESSEAP